MKSNVVLLRIFSIIFVSALLGCEDLTVLDDCIISEEVDVTVSPETNCEVPCQKVISLEEFQSLSPVPTINWSLRKGTEDIELPEPNASSFSISLNEPGTYLAEATLRFSFEGCDASFSKEFVIGEEPPQAKIMVSPSTECIVGDCDLTFSFTNEGGSNANSWTWNFPDDPQDYRNQEEVSKSFSLCPDTVQVTLTVSNFGGEDSDMVTIFVEPVTFDTTHKIGSGDFERVMCVEETPLGSFNLIGNTTEESYIASISRTGAFLSHSPINEDLEDFFGNRNIRDCHVVNGKNILVGRVKNENSGNNAAYFLVVDGLYTSSMEYAVFPSLPGNVDIWDITLKLDGSGYLACGSKSSGSNTGMFFLNLDLNFEPINPEAGDIIHFPGSLNKAFAIEAIVGGYMVVGEENVLSVIILISNGFSALFNVFYEPLSPYKTYGQIMCLSLSVCFTVYRLLWRSPQSTSS